MILALLALAMFVGGDSGFGDTLDGLGAWSGLIGIAEGVVVVGLYAWWRV